jgi:hypothetical protein
MMKLRHTVNFDKVYEENPKKRALSAGLVGQKKREKITEVVRKELVKALQDKELLQSLKLGRKNHYKKMVEDWESLSQDNGGGVDAETLSSVRYELLKIQQELLRRKVLDPRYYKAVSLDTLNAEARGGTSAVNEHMKHAQTARYSLLYEVDVTLGDTSEGKIEVLFDAATDSMLCRIVKMAKLDDNGDEIFDKLAVESGDAIVSKVVKQALAFMKLSRLIIHRATGYTLDDIFEAHPGDRANMLETIMFQLHQHASINPLPNNRLYLDINRLLYKTTLVTAGIIADLEISRNLDCNTMVIKLTSLNILASHCIVEISDQSLQVLLLNQQSLYAVAKTKWSAMEMVAQWLTTRVRVKRVRFISDQENIHDDENIELENFDPAKSNASDKKMAQSLSLSGVQQEESRDARENMMSRESADDNRDSFSRQESLESMSTDGHSRIESTVSNSISTIATPSKIAQKIKEMKIHPIAEPRVLLDMAINRRVELSKVALMQWKSRNVPNLTGMKIKFLAFQDLSLLKIIITLTIPHARLRRDKTGKSRHLIDFSQVDEGEEDLEEYYDEKKLKPTIIRLQYVLTADELAIFGHAELYEDRHVILSHAVAGDHPSTFVWNILSRLYVKFKVRIIRFTS